jgi:hypothetical protein
MSEKPELNEHEEWEMRVQKTSREFEFPTTPNIAQQVKRQLRPAPRSSVLGRVAAILLVLLMTIVVSVPEIRASVLEFLTIGAVRIIPVAQPTLTPAPTPIQLSIDSLPMLEFGTEVTLEEAQTAVDYAIPLPTMPQDLGSPNHVYLQETSLPMVVLVWDAPQGLNTTWLILYIINSRDTFFKFDPNDPQMTTVNEHQAAWLTTPHLLEFVERSTGVVRREIEANVLIWQDGAVTYRLEGELTLEQALEIAESLQ